MILKLKPVFFDKIWGGNYFQSYLEYSSSEQCGEAWGISGYTDKSSTILNGEFRGKTLREIYQSRKDLFGNYPSPEFPLLIKLIDAQKDLSIQVHPDNEYARKYHNSFGKTEAWYVVDCNENSEIVIGHNAKSKKEMMNKVLQNDYDNLLHRFHIKKEDMFSIPAGMVHAICKNTVILEVQQASDITYRLYDYNRIQNGVPRELHIKQAMDVIDFPSKPIEHTGESEYFNLVITNLEEKQYKADKYGDYYFIINGNAQINDITVKMGDFIFISSEQEYNIKGNLKVAKIQIK